MHARRLIGLLLLAAFIGGCSAGPGAGGQLEGGTWVLRSYADDADLVILPETLYADATFSSGRVHGFAGCNDYDALARSGGRTLLISQAAVTRKSCADDVTTFETTYLALLEASRLYSARADTLTIFGSGGETILVFDAAPKNPLLGTWDVESYADAPGSQVTPLEGTELTAVFGVVNVGGFAGCNTFDGTYGTNGTIVKIGRLATTRQSCSQAINDQETAFLEALQGAAFVERRGLSLILRARNDDVLVAFARPSSPDATASPSATPTATPKPSPTASATPTPTPKPTATPTARPTATPKPSPTATVRPSGTAAPTVAPPESIPPEADCSLTQAGGSIGTIVFPAAWYTTTSPPTIACRYFDPDPITVPSDPSTLETAITVSTYGDYGQTVDAYMDPDAWDDIEGTSVTVSGLPATLVEATSTSEVSGWPVGTTSYAYLIDLGDDLSVAIGTTGAAGSATYDENTSVVDLMAAESSFAAPG